MKLDFEVRVTVVELTAEMRQTLEPVLLGALRDATHELGLEGADLGLTLVQAREALQIQPERWATLFLDSEQNERHDVTPLRLVSPWEDLRHDLHRFLKGEGSAGLGKALERLSSEALFAEVWPKLFSHCVLPWLREQGYLLTSDRRSDADLLVEFAKLWIQALLTQLTELPSNAISSFFIDLDHEASATWALDAGSLSIHGRVGPMWIHLMGNGELALSDFRLAQDGPLHLRVAELLLTMLLVEHTRNVPCSKGRLYLLSAKAPEPSSEPAIPKEVEAAFAGYVGNQSVVRQLKRAATLARLETNSRLPEPLLLVAQDGMGQRELAKRLPQALGATWTDAGATVFRTTKELTKALQVAPASPAQLLYWDASNGHPAALKRFMTSLNAPESVALLESQAVTIVIAVTSAAQFPVSESIAWRRLDLEFSSEPEISESLTSQAASHGIVLEEPFAHTLALMSRFLPGRALTLWAEYLAAHDRSPRENPLTQEALIDYARENWAVDKNGLTAGDRLYLSALQEGPRTSSTLCQSLPLSDTEIAQRVLPFLAESGAIRTGPCGESLTLKGELLLQRESQAV